MRLLYAVRRQDWICWVSRGRLELRTVFACFVVDGKVQAVLVC